jgi:hypothetical protein
LKRQSCFSFVFLGLALAVGFSNAAQAVAVTPSPTSTELTISPSSPVALGTLVTLTASVTSSGQSVSPGLVLFCNAAAAYCEDLNILGQAQLTANGTASLNLILPVGPHQIRAQFQGTKSYASSSSPTEKVSASGKYTTTTAFLGYDETMNTFALKGAVTTLGQSAPEGTLTFTDTTNHRLPLATSPVGSPAFVLNSLAGLSGLGTFLAGPVADFNRDGKLDQLTYDSSTSSWVVLFGNGDGTFVTGPSTKMPLGFSPGAIVVGDFNNDDIPDFAFADGTNIDIRLGVGDGSFSAPASISIGQNPDHISVGDFDGDGNADLIVSSTSGTGIWLGNGTAGFSHSTSPSFPAAVSAIQIADLNGDGFADFVYLDSVSSTTVVVYLGASDGSFTATPTSINCYPSCVSTAVADFNSDGKPDLVVGENFVSSHSFRLPAGVVLALGNGDGTFAYQTSVGSGFLSGLGDFNGDGKMDIATFPPPRYPTYSGVLLGNGDGTFTWPDVSCTQTSSIGDFNNDGLSDLVGSPTAVLLAGEKYTATASGVTLTGPPGYHSVFASFEGDSMHTASASGSLLMRGPKVATAVNLEASPTPIAPGQAMRLVATVTPSTVGKKRATGTITFANGVNVLGAVPISDGRAVFTTSALPIGNNISLVAYYSGDDDFNPSVSVPVHLTTLGRLRPISTIQLSVSPSPQVAQGTVVTLSAKVLDAGKPLPNGLVIFYGTTSAHAGKTILGQAQLTSAGVATMKFRPPLGSLGFQAVYQGTNTHEGCGSDWQDLTVTGKFHTSTTISADPPTYSATVTAYGPLAASGDASFIDATDSNYVFATAPLKLSNTFMGVTRPVLLGKDAGVFYPSGVADFNGDGILDVLASGPSGPLLILQGNPDGTFTQKPTDSIPGSGGPVAIADFNSDGIPDLAVVQGGQQPSVAIFLGRGDGTFSRQSTLNVGPDVPTAIATGDFNGDGTPDLITTSGYQANYDSNATGTVLLGDGKGGFRAAPSVDLGSRQSDGNAVVADFNGDGIPDVATSVDNGFVFSLSMLLSKGDGTFVTSVLPMCDSTGPDLVEADFNGDGIPDILVNGCFTDIQMQLGNGSGTSFARWSLPSPPYGETWSAPAAAADFNGDGIPDLLLANPESGQFGILLGRGDGSFAAGPFVSVTGLPYLGGLVAGDFNGDGIPDFLLAGDPSYSWGTGGSAVHEWFSYVEQTSQAKATNVTLPGSGAQQVYALYPGDSTHIGSYSETAPATATSAAHQQK